MAEKDITTWEEFKAAIVENITEDTTYNIKNDIDASSDILTQSIVSASVTSSIKKVFNGNNFKINGITSYSAISVFEINFVAEFNNIHFSNFMLQDAKLLYSNKNSEKIYNGCLFNGLVDTFSAFSTFTHSFIFNSCSFNVKVNIFSSFNMFNSCYIYIEPFQETNKLGTTNKFTNCFIDGVLKNTLIDNTAIEHVGYTSQNSGSYPSSFYTANVFNCKVVVTNYNALFNYYGASRSNDGTVLNNADKIFQADGVTKIPASQLKVRYDTQWLTDAQLKDKNYIQQSTNFPLYG